MITFHYIIEEFSNQLLVGCLSLKSNDLDVTNAERKIIESKFIFDSFSSIEDIKTKWPWALKNEQHIILDSTNRESVLDYVTLNLFETSFDDYFKEFKLTKNESFANYSYNDLNNDLLVILNRKPQLFELHFYFSIMLLKYANYFEENPDKIFNIDLYTFYTTKYSLDQNDYYIEDFFANTIEVYSLVNLLTDKEILSINSENDLYSFILTNIDSEFIVNDQLNNLTKILAKSFLLLNITINNKEFNKFSVFGAGNKDEINDSVLEIILQGKNLN